MSHLAREAAMQRALASIRQLDVVRAGSICLLRVEDL
jgi:hypothetical protein